MSVVVVVLAVVEVVVVVVVVEIVVVEIVVVAAATAAVVKCYIIVCPVSLSLISSIVVHLGVEIFSDDCTLGEVLLHSLWKGVMDLCSLYVFIPVSVYCTQFYLPLYTIIAVLLYTDLCNTQ
jgi:hypothetical protein